MKKAALYSFVSAVALTSGGLGSLGLGGAALAGTGAETGSGRAQGAARVEVTDPGFETAGSFLAYTEFELSGEPLAEALGLDLDVLDPDQVNQPTAFDYAAGIESYEYSEEAMYAVNYQSRMGPHVVNGPVNAARGGTPESFGRRMIELAASVGFPVEEIPLNMYPITFPYVAGQPEFARAPDMTVLSTQEVAVSGADGDQKVLNTVTPAYARDFASLAWDEAGMDKTFGPAAAAGIMLKDVMWAQDFLGGMHVIDSDEEVDAASSVMDHDGRHALGVSSADGFNGVVLTEIMHDRLLTLREHFGFDGHRLGARFGAAYDPAQGAVWLPHRVAVTEAGVNGVKAIGGLAVTDGASTLRDTWQMLWPLAEIYAYSDQRDANHAQNPAFRAVFDGAPFAAAPVQNTDADPANDVAADDVFSTVSLLVDASFKNLEALHFNAEAGTLVDRYSMQGGQGQQSTSVTTYDAAYALQALSIYQRAQDALAVGYAAADAGESLNTERGQRALAILRAQADFILANLIAENGLAVDRFELGSGAAQGQSLGTQFAVMHGLSAAFLATGDIAYKTAARALLLAVEARMYDPQIGTYADLPGTATTHTPYTAAAISAGLRSAMLTLRNGEGEDQPLLDLASLTERYESWFRTVINGRNIAEGMQRAEWLVDTGEHLLAEGAGGDSDGDGVAQITAAGGRFGTAMVMAASVSVSAAP